MSIQIYLKDSWYGYESGDIMVVTFYNNKKYYQSPDIDVLQEMLDRMDKLSDEELEEYSCPRITIEAYVPNEDVDINTLPCIPNFKVDDSGTFIEPEKYHCEAHFNVNDPHDEDTKAFITLKNDSIYFSINGLHSGRIGLYAILKKDEFRQLIHEYRELSDNTPENGMSM